MKTYFSSLAVSGLLVAVTGLAVLPIETLVAAPLLAQNTDAVGSRIYQQASPAVVTIRTNTGSGSGFVVSRDGLTITNAHVLQGTRAGDIVTVTLADGRRLPGEVIGFGKDGLDLGVVKIRNQNNLPTLRLATSGVKVGQPVYAIGNPFGEYSNTFTNGIVTRLDEQRGSIQHNANIQPGNSGGPLVNSEAEVVGVNSSGRVAQVTVGGTPIAATDSTIGLNFAIPADRVQSFLAEVRRGQFSAVSTLAKPSKISGLRPKALKMGQSVTDSLSADDQTLGDRSYFKLYSFEGKAGQQVSVEMTSSQFDPLLQLRSPNGSSLAQNDDISSTDFNARIVTTLPENGTYTVVANAYGVGEVGSFSLQVVSKP